MVEVRRELLKDRPYAKVAELIVLDQQLPKEPVKTRPVVPVFI